MNFSSLYVKEARAISRAKGSLLIAESIPGIKYSEIVDVQLSNGEVKIGPVSYTHLTLPTSDLV